MIEVCICVRVLSSEFSEDACLGSNMTSKIAKVLRHIAKDAAMSRVGTGKIACAR